MRMRILVVIAIMIAGVSGAFYAGLLIGKGQIPAVDKVFGLLNKEGDALTAQIAAEPVDFMPYWRVWNVLERKFIPLSTSTEATVDVEDKVYRSIEGLVASYGDPYTVFMRPQVSADFKIATQGSLEGIGAVIGDREGKLIVVSPLPNSPAELAGLLAGDYIVTINGEETGPLSVDESVSRIRGGKGTSVVLSIEREGEERKDVTVVRGTIEIPSTAHAVIEREVPKLAKASDGSVKGETSEDKPTTTQELVPEEDIETEIKDFYLLRLFSFSQSSVNAFARELEEFIKNGSDSLIIDLRGNPGGYLEASVQIANWFLPKGSVVVREFRGPDLEEITHVTNGQRMFKDKMPKVIILVDRGSASASEILAGALQEHGVATIIGTRTFGKGSVQELVEITDELSLKVTIARWYTPNGVSISNGGLVPDILVDASNTEIADPWVEAAVSFLSEDNLKEQS